MSSSDTDPADRDESAAERADRRLGELLQELRVTLPGVQVLFAFLLTVPFSARFARTTELQRDLYFAALLGTALATALLMSPVALHRLRFAQGVKTRIVQLSHRLAICGVAVLGITITLVLMLVTDVLFDTTTAVIVAATALAVIVGLWIALPLWLIPRR